MERFAGLIDRLVYTPSRNRKLDALAEYFRTTPDPDRGYALAALTDGLFWRLPLRRILAELLEPHVDPVLYRLSRDYVGDTAETVALLWPEARAGPPSGPSAGPPPGLAEVVEAIAAAGRLDTARVIAGFLDRLDADGRFALLKLLTGALRTGVSARLVNTWSDDAGSVFARAFVDGVRRWVEWPGLGAFEFTPASPTVVLHCVPGVDQARARAYALPLEDLNPGDPELFRTEASDRFKLTPETPEGCPQDPDDS